MAIVEMKKIRLAAMKTDKRRLLRDLIRLGCVQLAELPPEEGDMQALTRRMSSDAQDRRGELSRLLSAVEILDRAVPEKKGLLTPKPEKDSEVFLQDSGVKEALELADSIIGRDERLRKLSADESKERSAQLSLQPWQSLGMDLSIDHTETTRVLLGTVPAKTSMLDLNAALAVVSDEAEICIVSEDREFKYLIMICVNEVFAEVQSALKPFSFALAPVMGMEGTPTEALGRTRVSLEAIAEEKTALQSEIESLSSRRDELRLAADRLCARIAMAEAEERMAATESCIIMQGWLPAADEEKLASVLASYDCAWETEAPSKEEYPEVPVSLRNNKFTNALNMVTNMYSLPLYGTVDPNPLMAPFFIVFYGLMMADMGYGLIMIAAAIVALKKLRPRNNSLSFCQLLLYCGVATFVGGALTGSFFSDVVAQFVTMITGTQWSMPYLFSPVRDSEMVLYGSLILGVIHLNTGMAVNFVQKVKRGETASAIWEEGSLWVILIGGILWFLDIGNISGIPIVLIIGVVMLLLGAGREKKGFGKVTAAVACIYNTATGWLGDVLSYARIMALMLAGGVVGQVFNSVAIMPMQSGGVNPLTILVFIVIFLLGHAMNFGLNILGCYVHDLRLQCLEFFGKFYADGGKPFTPLEISGKYNNVRR